MSITYKHPGDVMQARLLFDHVGCMSCKSFTKSQKNWCRKWKAPPQGHHTYLKDQTCALFQLKPDITQAEIKTYFPEYLPGPNSFRD